MPSSTPFFFSTTIILNAYGLFDSLITPFLSIIFTWSSIHLCSLEVWYSIFPTTSISIINFITCSMVKQFPISCDPFDTILSNLSRICWISSNYVEMILYKLASNSSPRCNMSWYRFYYHIYGIYITRFAFNISSMTWILFILIL